MFFNNPLNTPNYFQNTHSNTFTNERKNFGLKNYGMQTSGYLNAPERKQSRFADFFSNIGGIGGASMLTGAISGLGSLIIGSINASEQNKNAKIGIQMAKDQYQKENERYQLREQERLNNNEQINNIAKKYSSVMTRL